MPVNVIMHLLHRAVFDRPMIIIIIDEDSYLGFHINSNCFHAIQSGFRSGLRR